MPDPIARRTFLKAGVVVGGGGAASLALPPAALAAPALVLRRPEVAYGVQSDDVSDRRAVVWARGDRPARMSVEVSATADLRRPRRLLGPLLTPRTDLTGKLLLDDLPPGQQVFYRMTLADPNRERATGEPVVGTFRTPPSSNQQPSRDVNFVWSGDLAGQGWGINPSSAATGSSARCAGTTPTSSSAVATPCTPTGPSVTLPDGRRCDATSSRRRSPRSRRP